MCVILESLKQEYIMTTKTPHKHAAFIIQWATGETIQYMSIGGEWIDIPDCTNIAWHNNVEYRVKPAPIIKYCNVYKNAYFGSSFDDIPEAKRQGQNLNAIGMIKIEFIDGKLLSVSMV